MSYNFVYASEVVTAVVVSGIITAGIIAIVLAPASGGASIAVPMTYFVANFYAA